MLLHIIKREAYDLLRRTRRPLRSVNICAVDDESECFVETGCAADVQGIVTYLDDLNIEIETVGLKGGTLTGGVTSFL